MNATLREKPDAGNPHCKLLTASCLGALAALAVSATEVDWYAKTNELGEVTIPAGETRTATEDDVVSKFPNIAKITFADATATMECPGATAPTVTLVGAGTLLKSGANEWVLSATKTQPDFNGTIKITDGSVSATAIGTLGATTASKYATVDVDGGTLVYPADAAATLYQYIRLRLKGTGYANQGALFSLLPSTDNNCLKYISLTGDATIFFGGGFLMARSNVELNGHELNLKSRDGHCVYHRNSYQGPGTVTMDPSKPFTFSSRYGANSKTLPFTTNADKRVTFNLSNGSEIDFYNDDKAANPGVQKGPFDVALHLTGAKGTITSYQRYGTPSGPYEDFSVTLDGTVTNDVENATLAFSLTEDQSRNTAIDVKSKISGSVNLQFGTATSTTKGRVILGNAANDYTGTTTFYGGSATLGSLAFAAASAVPAASALTVNGGRLSLLERTGETWTTAKIAALANRTAFADGSHLPHAAAPAAGPLGLRRQAVQRVRDDLRLRDGRLDAGAPEEGREAAAGGDRAERRVRRHAARIP